MKRCPSAHELGPAIDVECRRWRPTGYDEGRVCLYVADRRRGRALVLMHDLQPTSSAHEMRPLFEYFRWRRPTFAVDLPGFGHSDRFGSPCPPARSAAVLGQLLRQLRRTEPPLDLVTLGRGSEVAARIARDEPGLVRSIVMLEPAPLGAAHRAALDWLGAYLRQLLGERVSRAVFALSLARPLVRHSLRARFHGLPDEGLLAYEQAIARAPGVVYRARLAALALRSCASETVSLYRALTVPVLVVHDSRGARAAQLEAFLHGRHNRFALRVSPTRGMPHFERRLETAAALERFWQTLPRAAFERAMR